MGEETVIATGVITGPEARGAVTIMSRHEDGVAAHIADVWIASGAPDVRIYLSPDRGGDVTAAATVELGKTSALSGDLEFAVPSAVDVASMGSLVVHCKVYSVTFGVAPLEHRAA